MSGKFVSIISAAVIVLGVVTVASPSPASASAPNCGDYNGSHGGHMIHRGTFGPGINFAIWQKGKIRCVRTWNNSKLGSYRVREWMTKSNGHVLFGTTNNYNHSTAVVFVHTSTGYKHVKVQGAYKADGSNHWSLGAHRTLW